MNILKLINRNMKKTFSDYLIYFVTLCFCSSLFFTYLTLGSKNHPLLSNNYVYSIEGFMSMSVMLTYVISLIFLGLTFYVNNFMIKQRTKEFSVYMILGICQKKIAKLFFIETYLIGIFAVCIGTILGTIFASFLSSFVIYYISGQVVYSLNIYLDVFLQTIIYFSVVFIIVGIFNAQKLIKMSLLEVINESKIVEFKAISKFKYSIFVLFTFFCISFPFIIYGNETYINYVSKLPSIYGVLPSFLPYISLYTGYYILAYSIKILINNKPKIKLNKLNIVFFNNLFSRILSNIRSIVTITVICIIATYTLVLGPIITEFSKSFLEYRLPYDLIINYQDTDYDKTSLLEDVFVKNDVDIDQIALIKEYTLDIAEYQNSIEPQIYGITDYNKARIMNNLEPIKLKSGEFFLHISNKIDKDNFIEKIYSENKTLNINDEIKLTLPSDKLKAVQNDALGEHLSYFSMIVPDETLKFLNLNYYSYYLNTKQPVKLEKAENIINSISNNLNILDKSKIQLFTFEENQHMIISAGMYAFFIGVGIIFFIIALTILTLQQLSDAKINKQKYGVIYKLGVTESKISKLINKQVGILFLIPCIFGIIFSSHFSFTFYVQWKGNIYAYMGLSKFILTVLFGFSVILIIFIIYYFITIYMYKNIIKDEFKIY